MKITIQGQDVTNGLDSAYPLTIERRLNEPSTCRLWLSLPGDGSLTTPLRNQSLAVTGDDGTPYFTGYIAVSPLQEFAGIAYDGSRYRIAVEAISDEFLLDQLAVEPTRGVAGRSASGLMQSLLARTGSATVSAAELTLDSPVNNFAMPAGAPWSTSAGQIASQARAAYRVVNGSLSLDQVPRAMHTLNEADGSLNFAALTFTANVKRSLANDVTVCGVREPVAYVTEYFLGDGVTTQFNLAAEPFVPSGSGTKIINELFNRPSIDAATWANSGGHGYLSLCAGGLLMNGGNGIDGNTLLSWLDPVEVAGTFLLEASGVTLQPGSTGILAGLFVGLETLSGCVAGFQSKAQESTGAVTLQPVVEGAASGTCYRIDPNRQYSLRVRVYCQETERQLSIYRSQGDQGAITFGGQTNLAPGKFQLEIQEFVNGVAAMPVTLYEGTIASLPPSCSIVAASSINLKGTMRSLSLTSLGSGWVESTPPNGSPNVRRLGTLTDSAECSIVSPGRLIFNSGFVPVAGEKIAVNYRTVGRAAGRAVDASNQAELVQAGLPVVAAWIGSVTNPPARSSGDCRNAAMTLVQAAASESALWSGTYKDSSLALGGDIWPGDGLRLEAPSAGMDAQLVIRTAALSYRASYPDAVNYVIGFANDWAADLAIRTSDTVPADAWMPAPVAPAFADNLTALTVTAMSGNAITINTGVPAPPGGGFEIRRRDFCFMPGEDTDLVMRGCQPNMTFSRESACDRFYVRMYDGSTPPNYSEFSTALFINMPPGS